MNGDGALQNKNMRQSGEGRGGPPPIIFKRIYEIAPIVSHLSKIF